MSRIVCRPCWEEKKLVAGGLSRILSRSVRAGLPPGLASDDHFSGPPVSRCLERPTRKSITDRADPYAAVRAGASAGYPAALDPTLPCRVASLFGLAPGGVCRAKPVTRPAGQLLLTVSPLPRTRRGSRRIQGGLFSVALSLSEPHKVNSDGGRYPPPHPLESGLSSAARPRLAGVTD